MTTPAKRRRLSNGALESTSIWIELYDACYFVNVDAIMACLRKDTTLALKKFRKSYPIFHLVERGRASVEDILEVFNMMSLDLLFEIDDHYGPLLYFTWKNYPAAQELIKYICDKAPTEAIRQSIKYAFEKNEFPEYVFDYYVIERIGEAMSKELFVSMLGEAHYTALYTMLRKNPSVWC